MKRPMYLLLICPLAASISCAFAQDDAVMRAMRNELDRSMKQIHFENLDRPYFIAYHVSDLTNFTIGATLGSLTSDQQVHTRQLTVEVRVGDYAMDNTNFLSFSGFGGAGVVHGFGNTVPLPLEDDYKEIRRQIWLATDAAYKKALADLSRKRAALKNKTRVEDVPDFSTEKPFAIHETPVSMNLDRARAEALVQQLSVVFRSTPEIHRSLVEIHAINEYARYVNSEGSEYTRVMPLVWVAAIARTQAGDGMPLGDALTVYARSIASLPAEQLTGQVREMTKRLVELRSAPLVERYNGPVLFQDQASAEILAQVFATRLIASRRPISDNPQFEMVFSRMENPFQDRVGSRVLPDWATVIDDPTITELKGTPLFGGYSVDDDSIRASKTIVVENGILKTLLVTRNPVRGMIHSTGNSREIGAAPSNLLLMNRSGLSDAALKEKLLNVVQQRGKPYGIVVRRMRNPLVGDPEEIMLATTSASMSMLGGGSGSSHIAVLAYKVYPDGHEQLIRNAQLDGINDASFKDLVAASTSQAVYSMPFFNVGNILTAVYSGGGASLNRGIPQLITVGVPDLIFEDVSVSPPTGEIPKPPISKPPLELSQSNLADAAR